MQVTFYKLTEQRVSYWEAVRPKRVRVPGSPMAIGRGGPPHDLLQLVVEAALGIERGFWGSVASGATFRSTGRKRTPQGKAVIAANRDALDEAERVANETVRRWEAGEPTPASAVLDEWNDRWQALSAGQGLVVEWPTLAFLGTVDTGGRNPIASR